MGEQVGSSRNAWVVRTTAALALTAGVALGAEPDTIETPLETPTPTEPSTTTPELRTFTDVGALLEAVEAADRATDSLRARIRHVMVDTLTGDTQVRDGVLLLHTDWDDVQDNQPMRRFAVLFESLTIGTRRDDDDVREYVFDGRWISERLDAEKQFNRWEIVAPGERLDPFDPDKPWRFWLPIGRTRAEVERIAVASIEPVDQWPDGVDVAEGLKAVANSDKLVQLRLAPREGSGWDRDWQEVRIWFDRGDLTPRVYVAFERTGDYQVSWLYDVKRNIGISAEAFSTEAPTDPGWQVTERPFRGSADGDTPEPEPTEPNGEAPSGDVGVSKTGG